MSIIKCKMCGGDLNLQEGQSVCECEYCGSRQTVPAADNEKKLQQFQRADWLRRNCEFDRAAAVYESIVAEFREESEAYWGLVLCKYGIEYVDDPGTGKKIPTCHRSSFESVMEDPSLEMAMDYADAVARRVYREEAKQIEEIRKGIIAVSANEQPYDIFICYKETDEKGDRTLDSVLAQDIYDALTDKDYRVFFARISLEDKLGVEYEPYIFAALNSAKIMLAVGTDYEYYNAVWVKNEWSRFLKLMAQDKSKYLIPCFKGLDAYDMPKEFAKLQAQDLGKVGAMQDLLRGIEKILPKSVPAVVATVAAAAVSDVSPLVKRGWMALEDAAWDEARRAFDQVLDKDPENLSARLGLYLGSKKIVSMAAAEENYEKLFYNQSSSEVLRIRKLADPETEAWLRRMDQITGQEVQRRREAAEKARRAEEEAKRALAAMRKAEEEKRRIEEEKRRIEEEKRQKEAAEQRKAIIQKQKKVQGLISAGYECTAGLKSDGTVVVAGTDLLGSGKVTDWTAVVAISVDRSHMVGLKSDGTVVAAGLNAYGCCNVAGWANIVAVSAGGFHTVGLKSDGTVIATKYKGDYDQGQCNVSDWRDIIAVSAGSEHTVGLKSNGIVVTAGYSKYGLYQVKSWRDIVAISAGTFHTVGLKPDGTVVAVGSNECKQCNVSSWRDIVAISAGGSYTLGLKSDGTVVAVGKNDKGQCDVSGWRDIVAISAGGEHALGLKSDGTVVSVGDNGKGQRNVTDWKLFGSLDTLEKEREEARTKAQLMEQIREGYRREGRCQHCGGELKGFLFKKCVSCGKPKDY